MWWYTPPVSLTRLRREEEERKRWKIKAPHIISVPSERRNAKNACDVKIAVELKGCSQRDDDEEGKQNLFFLPPSLRSTVFVVFAERKIRSNENGEHCISHAPLYIFNFQGFLKRKFLDLSGGRVCETPCTVVAIIWTQKSALLFRSAPSKQHFFCFVFLRRRRFLAGAPRRCEWRAIFPSFMQSHYMLEFRFPFCLCLRSRNALGVRVSRRVFSRSRPFCQLFTLQMHECKSCTLKERI